MSTASVAEAVARAATELSEQARATLIHGLQAGKSRKALREAVPTAGYRRVVDRLLKAWTDEDALTADAVALALEASAAVAARSETVSVVWTGPTAPKAFPVRRTDQALLDLIASATKRVTIVSFVIYKVADITNALREAANRGVAIDLIFESEPEAKAKSAREMRDAIGKTTGTVRLLEWSVDKRPPKPSGKLGSLHAKCAIADVKRLLVSSANLTELAHWFNMELGLLVEGGDVPRRVQAHFDALIAAGQLEQGG